MNNLKYSVRGQMLLMTKTHLSTALLFMILFLLTFSMNGMIKDIIFAIFGTLGYFLSIYTAAGKACTDDKKTISPLNPKPAKGFILPLILTLSSLIIFVLYKLAWTVGLNGQYLTGWAVVVNIFTLLWTSPYQPYLLGMGNGTMAIHGYLIVLLVPIIASGLGYYATNKGFDLSEKVHNIIYEKKKDKNEF